jgi:hypothetical protein
MGRAYSTHGEKRNAYRILFGMPEGKRRLGRSRHRKKKDIRMNPRATDWGGMAGLIWLRIGTSVSHRTNRSSIPHEI